MTATATHRPRLQAALESLLLTHRDTIVAGVPCCTCGHPYPANSHRWYHRLHARHVADLIARLIIGDSPVSSG